MKIAIKLIDFSFEYENNTGFCCVLVSVSIPLHRPKPLQHDKHDNLFSSRRRSRNVQFGLASCSGNAIWYYACTLPRLVTIHHYLSYCCWQLSHSVYVGRLFSGELQWAAVIPAASDGRLWVLGLSGQGSALFRSLWAAGFCGCVLRLVVCKHDRSHWKAVQPAAWRDIRVRPLRRVWMEVFHRTGLDPLRLSIFGFLVNVMCRMSAVSVDR